MKHLALFYAIFSLCGAPALAAQDSAPLGADLAPAPTWAELSPQERATLAPLGAQFDRLDNQQRRKWRALAERARRWTPQQLRTAQSRMAQWAAMTPQQREAAREQAKAARQAHAGDERERSWEQWSQGRSTPSQR